MASSGNALICAGVALVLWTCVGLSLSLRLMPPTLAWPSAPALGWAVHSAIALPVFCMVGMAKVSVVAVTAFTLLAAVAALYKFARPNWIYPGNGYAPVWKICGAAVLAVAIMATLLPKITAGGVVFADVIFDHSKVAMVEDMARLGVPAGNPFFGERDGLDRLSYYYLWHFSAAELVVLTGVSGWEADAGLTAFTAFSSLMLMMGFAQWLSGKPTAAGWVLILATAFSIRPSLRIIFGRDVVEALTGGPTGFGGWLFQMMWAPQHVASAGCVLIAVLLLVKLSTEPSVLTAIVLSFVVAAAFESSTWVGGVTFPLAAIAIGSLILIRIEPGARLPFAVRAVGAALLATAIASLFIHDQFRASQLRAEGSPIGIMPYEIMGDETPERLRSFLNILTYWTTFLFTEFAAFYPTGIIMMIWLAKDRSLPQAQRIYVLPIAMLAFVSLGVGSLLISQLGGNNDLGWRGVLPAILVLIIFAAAGLARYLRAMPFIFASTAMILVGLGLFEGLRNINFNLSGQSKDPSALFVGSPRMWEAVRRQSGSDERVANNPLFLSEMTRWPINLSWALLANRRSCYAGSGFGPFAPRSKLSRDEIDAQFDRVFSGRPQPSDIEQLSAKYNCDLVLMTPQDGAWKTDPFAWSPFYILVEFENEAWRIYRRRGISPKKKD